MKYCMSIFLIYFAPLVYTKNTTHELDFVFWPSEPYIFIKDGKIDGALPKLLNQWHRDHCRSSPEVTITYSVQKQRHSELTTYVADALMHQNVTKGKIIAVAPILPNKNIPHSHHNTVKEIVLMTSPGYTLVANYFTQAKIYRIFTFGLPDSGTVLFIAMTNTLLFGTLVWLVERRKDAGEGEFSYRLLPGIYDGFWWAAVTLTSVGYGDLAPKTILGRFIGIVWLIISCMLLAAFGAIMTSSVTAEKVPITGLKVAYLNGTSAKDVIEEKSGIGVAMTTYEEAMAKAENMEIYGALIDTNYIAVKQDELYKRGIVIDQKIHENELQIMIMIPKSLLNATGPCLGTLQKHIESHSSLLKPHLKKNPHEPIGAKLMPSSHPMGITATLCYVTTSCLLIAGIISETAHYLKVRKERRKNQAIKHIADMNNRHDSSSLNTLVPQLRKKMKTMYNELVNMQYLVDKLEKQTNGISSSFGSSIPPERKITSDHRNGKRETPPWFLLQTYGDDNKKFTIQA